MGLLSVDADVESWVWGGKSRFVRKVMEDLTMKKKTFSIVTAFVTFKFV